MQIPVTLVTGYLGAGKTTIIINLIEQLSREYKCVWLKNEYGDLNVDAVLAGESNIQVAEIMNGCLCCVLVGRLHDAVDEIIAKYAPDRIIIESSGTAYPLPITLELARIPAVKLDGVITVIDALNFRGYHDRGEVAKLQNEVVDLFVVNKTGLVNEIELDAVLDGVLELNPHTPYVKTGDGKVDKDLLIGLDPKALNLSAGTLTETLVKKDVHSVHKNPQVFASEHLHQHADDVDTWETEALEGKSKAEIEELLNQLKQREFIRIKGVVNIEGQSELLNWVLGRTTWQALENYSGSGKVVFMCRAGSGGIKWLQDRMG
jgi:G3E family GTPase